MLYSLLLCSLLLCSLLLCSLLLYSLPSYSLLPCSLLPFLFSFRFFVSKKLLLILPYFYSVSAIFYRNLQSWLQFRHCQSHRTHGDFQAGDKRERSAWKSPCVTVAGNKRTVTKVAANCPQKKKRAGRWADAFFPVLRGSVRFPGLIPVFQLYI